LRRCSWWNDTPPENLQLEPKNHPKLTSRKSPDPTTSITLGFKMLMFHVCHVFGTQNLNLVTVRERRWRFFIMLSLASEGFGKVRHSERSKGFSRDHKISHFGGIKEGKYMVIWRDFPYASALFGFQSKIACSNDQGISIYLFQLLDCKSMHLVIC